jgi:hypothetical protein
LHQLSQTKAPALPPIDFILQLLFKAEKFNQEMAELPAIPAGVELPQEDIEIVRSALVSLPILVAADEPLRDAVNKSIVLGLRAISPESALELARDS